MNWANPQQSAVDAVLSAGWIQAVEWFPEIDSTHNAARRMLRHSATPLPALFVADRQTAGRGRNSRQWWSPTGCLMLTVAVDGGCLPDDPGQWSQLALVCGLAVAETAGQFVEDRQVRLKWPNDVYVRGRKLAGILIESVAIPTGDDAFGAKPNWLIGIGLNVDLTREDTPVELRDKATCLSKCAGITVDSKVTLVELMGQLQRRLVGWRTGELPWLDGWRERCLLSGREIIARLNPDREISGICDGVDVAGKLIVRNDSGVHILAAGEVLAWR